MYILMVLLLFSGCRADEDRLDDIDMSDDEDAPKINTQDGGVEMVKKAMSEAMKRPGAAGRLGQVLPIVRTMTPPQRLALASMVMAQITAGDEGPMPLVESPSKNLTEELMLPISADIATMFRGLGAPRARSTLMSQPNIRRLWAERIPGGLQSINRRNVQILSVGDTIANPSKPLKDIEDLCLTKSICSIANDYPEDEILASLRRSKKSELAALTSDHNTILSEEEIPSGSAELHTVERSFNEEGDKKGRMCDSKVELARPKRARATSGLWKYIVNTGDYTQTLRLEICSTPGNGCTFLSQDVDSECVQVYNYHRLLTWDETQGLTMDIFKVPTCCSCRVRGYGGESLHKEEHSNRIQYEESRPHKVVRGTGGFKRVKHRGPPLPLENTRVPNQQHTNYPPYENPLRRITRNNNTFVQSNSGGIGSGLRNGPNQRHPTLPAESVSTSVAGRPLRPEHSRPPRINYSYHPIIEFFRPSPKVGAAGDPRLEWTPNSSPAVQASPNFYRHLNNT